jgi:hypothetical protein
MADSPHLHVEFYTEAEENPALTLEAGRPIFEDKEFVRIRVVGDPKSSLIAPAHSASSRDPQTGRPMTYAEKFPEHYRYFKDNQDQQAAAGTPLSEMPWLTAAKRAELKALQIHTVEGLAGLDGTMLSRIGMGARELKNKAEAWLAAAEGNAGSVKMAAELAARDEQIEALQRQMADLIAASQGKVVPTANEPDQTEPDVTGSPFAQWQDDDIKNWIKDNTGARPLGNPSHATLVARADEINAELAAKAA